MGLEVRDLRFAQQAIQVQTDDPDGPKEATFVLQPATIIEGRVLAADTGQPIPGAVIAVTASQGEFGGYGYTPDSSPTIEGGSQPTHRPAVTSA